MSFDPERADWHVITRTEGGVVSILKNLTLHAAKEAAHRLRPEIEKIADYMRATGQNSWQSYRRDSDIVQTTIIGPEGWEDEE